MTAERYEEEVAYSASEPPDASVRTALRSAWSDVRAMAREHAYLAVLEAQRAGLQLTYILAAVLVVSVLLVTAWLALVTGLVVWLTARIGWPGVLAIAAAANILAAVGVGFWVKSQLTHLPFSATLRQLAAGRRDITTRPVHAKS